MMTAPSVMLPAEIIVSGRTSRNLVFGVLAPLSGLMGVIGPSVVNCARLAAEEASAAGNGQLVDLVLVDAGRDPAEIANETYALVSSGLVDGLVGCHTSDVRAAVSMAVRDAVPYVFTPPREFSTADETCVFLGPTPDAQLREPLRFLSDARGVRRWALVGSDYVWPRHVHAAARRIVAGLGHEVVSERTVAFGAVDTQAIVDEAVRARAQGIVVSLIGRDAIEFHRDFGGLPESRSILRLCTSFDEDCLLGIDGDTSGNLFAAMPSFLSEADDRHLRLLAAYQSRFGDLAPSPGAYSESSYDGVHLLAELHMGGYLSGTPVAQAASRLLDSPSSGRSWQSAPLGPPRKSLSLARADGAELSVVSEFALA